MAATWADIKAYLEGHHETVLTEEGALGVVVTFEGSRRTQKVWIEADEDREAPVIVMRALVCHERALSARDALAMNDELIVGTLARKGDAIVLRWASPVKEITAPLLERNLEVLAHESLRLRGETRNSAARAADPLEMYAA